MRIYILRKIKPLVFSLSVFLPSVAIVVAVEHRGNRVHLFWEQTQVQLGVALFDQAAQGGQAIDSASGPVDGTAVTPNFFLMTGTALVLCDELLALCQVSALVKRRHVLRLCYKANEPQAQYTQAFHAT